VLDVKQVYISNTSSASEEIKAVRESVKGYLLAGVQYSIARSQEVGLRVRRLNQALRRGIR
jgi:hypothetical protein